MVGAMPNVHTEVRGRTTTKPDFATSCCEMNNRKGRGAHQRTDNRHRGRRLCQRMARLFQALVWMALFHLALTEFLFGAGRGRRPDRLASFRERSTWSAVLARRYAKFLGVVWGFNANAEASPSKFWRRLGSEWRRLGAKIGESLLPSESEMDAFLRPLESRCFTYLPVSWSGPSSASNETVSEPFIFQWCHEGRATLHIQDGRRRQQLDFGTNVETTVSFERIRTSGRDIFMPTVVQRFSGGDRCEDTAAGREREGQEDTSTRGDVEEEDVDELGLTVRLWCCGPAGKDRKETGGAEIVNLVKGSWKSGNRCNSFVASVCTNLLCPLYEEFLNVDSAIDYKSGIYRKPPPPAIVSRRERGFIEYDRRKVMSTEERLQLKKEIHEMFMHGYDGYMKHAFPGGELLPLSCQSGELHLIKLPLVTLVDSLDTLAVMGNASEFRKAVRLVSEGLDVTADVDVSVFETNIRLLGGLLSAHLLASDPDLHLYPRSSSSCDCCCCRCRCGGDASACGNSDDVEEGGEKQKGYNECDEDSSSSSSGGGRFCRIGLSNTDTDATDTTGDDCINGISDATDRACDDPITGVTDATGIGCEERGGCGYATDATGADEEGGEKCGCGCDCSCEDYGGEECYDGQLLVLAEGLGRQLLPAFETPTGIPYGTVNLKNGVPEGETTISSLAGAGSLTVEFSVLSALTGNGIFAQAAEGAVKGLFDRRSAGLGLVGKHINTSNGAWTETESGIGTNGDSFYEYLLKMYVLWGDVEYWDMFMQLYLSIQRFVREGDWYAGVEISSGVITARTFDNLMAFWPGMQVLLGDLSLATRSLNSMYLIWRDWGFLPEQFDHYNWELKGSGIGRAYPLRPELVESTLCVYKATGDPSWLWAAKDFLSSLKAYCRTDCGFAGVKDVDDCTLDDQMPSFFLSETLKYLYLLFDEENFIHKGDYVFSTEAHPFSIDTVRRGGKFRTESIKGGVGKVTGGGAWAALRTSVGEGHRLGPERWRDENIRFWVQGAGGLEERSDAAVMLREELRYMRTLWKMYMERICPVTPWWMAPYRYSPSSFIDSLTTGGRMAWFTLLGDGVRPDRPAGEKEQAFLEQDSDGKTYQYLHLEGVGIFVVSISADGHDFTVFHTETGETLQVSQVFGVDAGLGVPGSPDGGAMHVSGYFQALPKIMTTAKTAEGGSGSVGEVEEKEVDLEGEGEMEGVSTPSDGRGNPVVEGDVDVEDDQGKEDYGEENDGGDDDGEENSEGGHGEGEGARGGRGHRTEGIIKALERVSPVRNLLVTKEGLSVYCTLSLLKTYPCSLAMFSAPGAGLLIIPPVDAPLHLVETSFDSSSNSSADDSLGCRLPEEEEADYGKGSKEEELREASTRRGRPDDSSFLAPDASGSSSGRGSVGRRGSQHRTLWAKTSPRMAGFQQARVLSPDGAEKTVPVDDGDGDQGGGVSNRGDVGGGGGKMVYTGKILVVSRGDCTFERKAKLAEAGGAVGLVIINHEPGGLTFTMSGETPVNGEAHSGVPVTIPVVMVGMEDGAELRRALVAMSAAEGAPVKGVLDVRTLHQRFVSRLVREKNDGLRDSNGVLVVEPGQSVQSPPDDGVDDGGEIYDWNDTKGDGDVMGDDDILGEYDAVGDNDVKGDSYNLEDDYIVGGNDIVRDYNVVGDDGVVGDDDAAGDIVLVDDGKIVEGNDVMGGHGGGEEEFSFLPSGFDEVTLGGMRPPPFLLPMALVGENYVQVMSTGHWGVVMFPHQHGRWALALTYNVYNPPRQRRKAAGEAPSPDTTAAAPVSDGDDGTCADDTDSGDEDYDD